MIKKLIILQIAYMISFHICFASDSTIADKNIKITYISNEGFLIEVGSNSILIDALFGDKQYGFCDIPDSSQIKSMRNAEDIFEDIDLITATHRHIDHFYAPFVIDHLLNNKNGN